MIGVIRFDKKQNCAFFFTNLQIWTRKTRTLVIKVVEKSFSKNTIFGVSIVKYNIGTISFEKKKLCYFFHELAY
jgi:hypothetical protein